MNDITALMATMKAAAEKATPGRIGDRIDGSGSIKYQCFGNDGWLVLRTDHKNMEYGFIGQNSNADELFFRMCSPENIKALVEALEKALPSVEIADLQREKIKRLESDLWDKEQLRKVLSEKSLELSSQIDDLNRRNNENNRAWSGMNAQLEDELESAKQRIAELESRTVTVKLLRLKQTESGERYVWSDGIFNYRTDVIEILRAAGILVIEGES